MANGDSLSVNDLVAKQADLLTADKATRELFLQAIEQQITAADPKGIEPLIAYIRQVQFAGRMATDALAKLVKEKAGSSTTLNKTEKAILECWSNDTEATLDNVMAKFAEGLGPEDRKVVDTWLSELSERERSLVTTGAIIGRDIDGGLFLAANLYRGKLAGVSREKLLSALRICQIYCGLPAYVAAGRTLVILEQVLGELAEKKDATPADVIAALVKRFDMSL